MKKLFTTLLILFSVSMFAQQLELNPTNQFYEYNEVVEYKDDNLQEKILKRFNDLNLSPTQSANTITGNGRTSHLVMGSFTVEIEYVVKAEIKDNRYRLTYTNFLVSDRNGKNTLEQLGSYKKKWIKNIDNQLPKIVENFKEFSVNTW